MPFGLLQCAFLATLLVQSAVCAPLQHRRDPQTVSTPFGVVTGAQLDKDVVRFTVPFAEPPLGALRFANPQPIGSFDGYNASSMPHRCFQGNDNRGGTAVSEDCLYSTYYRPTVSAKEHGQLPILVWFHGGSGLMGGSSQAGLDGTQLASSQRAIVVVPQYRLNLFGWLQTGKTLDEQHGGAPGQSKLAGNQAIRDCVLALTQIRALADAMGGDASRVTIIGQSSGATMMRALLTTPDAQSLFNNAILISDPLNYGLSSAADNNELGERAMKALGCAYDDLACARSKSAQQILEATNTAYSAVPQSDPRIAAGTPWRAMVGSYVTSSLAQSPYTGKKVIMTTTKNEIGSLVGSTFEQSQAGAQALYLSAQDTPIPMSMAANLIFNQGRGAIAADNTEVYPVNKTQQDGLRSTLETIGTDGMWRCAVQHTAVQLAKAGASVWLAEWQLGATYPSNEQFGYCSQPGRVCHEDDIYLIFGTAAQPTSAMKRATKEMQARYASFARSSMPNAFDALPWLPISSDDHLNMLVVRSDGSTSSAQTQHPAACAASLWGETVKFDWQTYPVQEADSDAVCV